MSIALLNQIDSFVWGPPLLVLLVGTGIFLSFRLGFLQIFRLPRSLKLIFSAENQGEGDIDSFKAVVEPVTEWYIGELKKQGYKDAEELVAAFK